MMMLMTVIATITTLTTFSGMERPGRIRFFDSHGEVIHQTEFHPGLPPGLNFESPSPAGGLGPEETGNRGTKYGLNM